MMSYFFTLGGLGQFIPTLWHDERAQRAKQLPVHPAAVINVLQYSGLS